MDLNPTFRVSPLKDLANVDPLKQFCSKVCLDFRDSFPDPVEEYTGFKEFYE